MRGEAAREEVRRDSRGEVGSRGGKCEIRGKRCYGDVDARQRKGSLLTEIIFFFIS